MVLRWIREGFVLGLRSCVLLAIAGVVMALLAGISMLPCYVPSIFVVPPLVGGLALMYVRVSRREPFSFGALFAGFSEGRYWPSMGVFWMSALIGCVASVPTYILLLVGLWAGIAAIAEWGTFGLIVLAILVPLAFAPAIYVQSRLIWATPLALDRRLPVMDAFAASWRLTGRVLKGFGTFILLILLAVVGQVVAGLVLGVTMAIFAGGLGAVFTAASAQEAELARQSSGVDRLPRPGETSEEYTKRVENEEAPIRKSQERLQKLASETFVMTLVGFALSTVIWTILAALLGAILGMPVIVGYRDMAPWLGQPGP